MELINNLAEQWTLPTFVVVILIAIVGHLLARLVSQGGIWLGSLFSSRNFAKVRTVIRLLSGVAVFAIYFLALGAILEEYGISLTAYLATASVIGLAIGFGSQSVVQDVVTGITVILSDLIDVGDMVEISGQAGIVRHVGMRFTVLQNAMGAMVYIPNRTLTNLINYPRGYIRCLVDLTLPQEGKVAEEIVNRLPKLTSSFSDQFPGVLRAPIEIEPRRSTSSGKEFVRIKFRIWPNRGAPIEGSFKQDLLSLMASVDEQFRESQLVINYEVDAQPVQL